MDFYWTVDLYSKRTGKLVETKSFYTRERMNWYIDAREKEGLWFISIR